MPSAKSPDTPQESKAKKYPHAGHRERMRNRFRTNGLKEFTDFDALELFLFYVIPRRDTRPISHALLEKFGSLTAVFNAPVEKLLLVPGVGPETARFLQTIRPLLRRMQKEPNQYDKVNSTKELLELAKSRLQHLTPPLLCLYLLNDINQITYTTYIKAQDFPSFADVTRTITLRNETQMTIIEWGTPTSSAITADHTCEVRNLVTGLNGLNFLLWDYIALPALDKKPLSYRRRGQLIS